jgi:NADP-dependent 3-hydroxy acid dehydrogenase YdfG
LELVGRGYDVIATARRALSLNDLPVAATLALDVTDSASVKACIAAAEPVDVLVNNAGMTVWGPVESPNEIDVQNLFETNLFGALRMVRAVLPGMRTRGSGAIYQVSSAASRRPSALLGHYAATKAALGSGPIKLLAQAGFG